LAFLVFAARMSEAICGSVRRAGKEEDRQTS
jgi:hypothetical protein